MRNLITCAEARALDARTRARAALDSSQLMEKASLRLWDALKRLVAKEQGGDDFPAGWKIVALCGNGDNGGDTMAMLRHAVFEGASRIAAVALDAGSGSGRRSGSASQRVSIDAMGLPVIAWAGAGRKQALEAMEEADLILDGILGTGLESAPRGDALELIRACNSVARRNEDVPGAGRPIVVAVDLPSGICDGMAAGREFLRCDATLCLEPLKACLYAPAIAEGRGRVIPVGGVFPLDGSDVPALARLMEAEDARNPFAPPSPAAFKTRRGRVAVFAGAPGSTGAARLCAEAALRAGAGYVAVFADEGIAAAISRECDEIMVRPLGRGVFIPSDWDIVLAGPGWGTGPDRESLLEEILGSGLPVILDADALGHLPQLLARGVRPRAPIAITPHPGEFRRLTSLAAEDFLADPWSALGSLPAIGLPEGTGIILKSHLTWIRVPDGGCSVWQGMESGLAVAGSGDVLAGLVAGLAAAGLAVEGTHASVSSVLGKAMESGVAVQGLAGKRLRKRKGWFLAHEIAEEAASLLGIPGFSGIPGKLDREPSPV